MSMMLNVGCGSRYHSNWINIDFKKTGPKVIVHNLLNGIPFGANEFDVVYHSHVLEHFTKRDGKMLIAECYRVLKPGGIIRVVVPDLELIAEDYLKSLEAAWRGDMKAMHNHEWMVLEMYDQVVRTHSGGEMATYLNRRDIPNEDFIVSRWGQEAVNIRTNFLKSDAQKLSTKKKSKLTELKLKVLKLWRSILSNGLENDHFRSTGEIHQWMYDKVSMRTLLQEAGFRNFEVKTAFESNIQNWNQYELESKNSVVQKPDSLFVEAIKP